MAGKSFDGPIPGENFTSDTKNYPWHRPPEHTDMDSAIEEIFKKLTSDDVGVGIITMIEMGSDISTITDMIVTAGIGAGKWTPDFAILLAGPTAHIIYLMAKGYGIDPEWGYETEKRAPTATFFKSMKKIEEDRVKAAAQSVDLDVVQEAASGVSEAPVEEAPKVGGFMGMSAEG